MNNSKPSLKGFNSLFESNNSTQQPKKLQISKLKPFDKHPFKGYDSIKMQSLADSIKTQGIIVPILVRPIEHEKYDYEIVAGHNRVQASLLAELESVPCDVRELDDETATIMMVDSNLQQRETILPSEKAFAYKYKLEAIKAQGKRTDLTCAQLGHKLENKKSIEKISEYSDDSRNQIQRYIRLTNLIPELIDKVDERKLAFIPAVELSYLKEQEQKDLLDILSREEKFGVPLKQANLFKGISQHGELTYEKIDKIITKAIKEKPKNFKVPFKKVESYFDSNTTPKEFESTILKALDAWFEAHPKQVIKEHHSKER